MIEGKLAWYNPKKGYGFLTRPNGHKDIFVHISEFKKAQVWEPEEGMMFTYEASEYRGRELAINLKKVDTELN